MDHFINTCIVCNFVHQVQTIFVVLYKCGYKIDRPCSFCSSGIQK